MNYQQALEAIIASSTTKPRLLLHSCCAPCASYVLEYLHPFFDIAVFYFNPNIAPADEYERRTKEQSDYIAQHMADNGVTFTQGTYDPDAFYTAIKGLESLPEGSERCFACYELRLRASAQEAKEGNYDYFASTLSISPHKNATKLNEIGERLAQEFGVKCLPNDFKKKGGFKRSTELSAQHNLYRQDYCGCVFSKAESLARAKAKTEMV